MTTKLTVGDKVRALRTVSREWFKRGEVYTVAEVTDSGADLDNGFRLYGPDAIRQYREGRVWERVV